MQIRRSSKTRYRKRILRRLRWILLIGLGCLFVLVWPISVQSQTPIARSVLAESPSSIIASQLLQQGIDRYEAEQFVEAIEQWQQALSGFEQQGDILNQAFTWSNLSLAYQQLGQWSEATTAIANSLNLLQQPGLPLEALAVMQGKALNTQGRLYWSRGQLEQALQAWQQATRAYAQVNDATGVLISTINQARALQSLGFSTQAQTQLAAIEQQLQQQPDSPLKAAGLRSYGTALRRVGLLDPSRAVLLQSLAIPQSPESQSATALELGNTERLLRDKAIAIGDRQLAQQHGQAALTHYQQAAAAAKSLLQRLQAQINQLSLQVSLGLPAEAMQLFGAIEPALADLPPSRAAVYARLNLAKSLTMLANAATPLAETGNRPTNGEGLNGGLSSIERLLSDAVQQAQALQDPIAESYAIGQLGGLREQEGHWAAAQTLTEQALLKAEQVQAADVRYRWEWQLGRLLERQDDRAGALTAYQSAVNSLKTVRRDLLATSTDVQFSFRDDVEPVYRGLVKLLLTTEPGGQPTQANLRQSIQQVDALQLTELENFLGCNLAQTVEITEVDVDPTAAKIYPMLLDDRLAVVLEAPQQPLQYHAVRRSRQEIEAIVRDLRQNLREPDRTPEAIAQLQEVYGWLIAPFASMLNQSSLETLVFVLDGELRNIPMAALFDGQTYLVERYAIAVAPRLALFKPSPRPAKLNLFLGGVEDFQPIVDPQTQKPRTFPKIENLEPELDGIQQIAKAHPPLINAAFVKANLQKQLKSGEFSAIHIKTHGVFSSDPNATFIVAYDNLILSRDLGQLIQAGRLGESSPVELLVLSACSTAEGDDRAVLGLAGTAVQAGARSVISTLWEAQDVPNTQLMLRFYQSLMNPHLSRAKALQQAQLSLLAQGYRAPHVWATYVLVGNWL